MNSVFTATHTGFPRRKWARLTGVLAFFCVVSGLVFLNVLVSKISLISNIATGNMSTSMVYAALCGLSFLTAWFLRKLSAGISKYNAHVTLINHALQLANQPNDQPDEGMLKRVTNFQTVPWWKSGQY